MTPRCPTYHLGDNFLPRLEAFTESFPFVWFRNPAAESEARVIISKYKVIKQLGSLSEESDETGVSNDAGVLTLASAIATAARVCSPASSALRAGRGCQCQCEDRSGTRLPIDHLRNTLEEKHGPAG